MIHIVHRGKGGRYTNYAQEAVRKIARRRTVSFSNAAQSNPGFQVAIDGSGLPLTMPMMMNILTHNTVTFYIGDSRGLPSDVLSNSHMVVSVSSLPLPHHLEAVVLIDQIERFIIGEA